VGGRFIIQYGYSYFKAISTSYLKNSFKKIVPVHNYFLKYWENKKIHEGENLYVQAQNNEFFWSGLTNIAGFGTVFWHILVLYDKHVYIHL